MWAHGADRISDWFALQHAVTALKRLDTAGFIARTRDTQGERRVLMTLTAKRCATRQAALRVPRPLSAGYDTGEAEELRDEVRRLVGQLAARGAESPRT